MISSGIFSFINHKRFIFPFRMQLDVPPELELMDGESTDIKVSISEVFPLPEVLFYLNTKLADVEEISSSNPQQDGSGLFEFTQVVRYKADYEDTGKKLICIARQIDHEGNVVESQAEVFLNVKAQLPPAERAGIPPAAIGGIVGGLLLLLLILILVGAAFRAGWLCFAPTPVPVVYTEKAKAETNEADIQTDARGTADSGNHAAFGPSKPGRGLQAYDQFQGIGDEPKAPEYAPLIGGASAFAQDGTKAYDDEGIGSRAGSLPSLNRSSIDERDWKDTLQVLGPKFSKLADYMRGEHDEDDEEGDDGGNKSDSSSDSSDVEKGGNHQLDLEGGSEV